MFIKQTKLSNFDKWPRCKKLKLVAYKLTNIRSLFDMHEVEPGTQLTDCWLENYILKSKLGGNFNIPSGHN